MDQEAAIEAFLARYKNPQMLELMRPLVTTPRGRTKLAYSLVQPVKLALDYLKSTRKPFRDIEYSMQSRLTECQKFFALVPEEEQEAAPFPELKGLVTELDALIKERSTAP